MKVKLSGVLALVLTVSMARPARADCCDSILGCAASIATDGLSCLAQQIVATVKSLVNLITNLVDRTSGATQAASDGAQALVNQTISDLTTQSQQSGADLAAALQQANAILRQESAVAVAPPPKARPVTAGPAKPATGIVPIRTTLPPPGALVGLFQKGVAEIQSLKAAGDPDVTKVSQFMAQARQSEGPGVQSALSVANQAINAPLQNMLARLNSLLSDPMHIFDPTDMVDQMANSVMANLDVNINQMVTSILAGPQKAFDAAQPAYDELTGNGDRAKAIAAAMQAAYSQRTQASQNALAELLPFPSVATSSNLKARSLVGAGGRRLYAQMMSTVKARQQQVANASKQKIQAIGPLVSQYKTLRTQAAAARAAVPTYKANFSRQLSATMAGKTQAQINAQRDALVAQARSQFAGDPKTRDTVIQMVQTESAKIKATAK